MPDGPSSPARGEFTGEPKKYSNVLDQAESGLALKMSIFALFLPFSSNLILSTQSIEPLIFFTPHLMQQCSVFFLSFECSQCTCRL